MENPPWDPDGQLVNLLAERVAAGRTDLAACYQHILQESLFTNRAFVRPALLKQIAADEVDALLNFLRQPGFSGDDRGEKLHQAGFNVGAILRLGKVTRQFLLNHLENHQIIPMLETVDSYQQVVIEGFVQSIDKEHLSQLEQTRNIFRRNDS